MCTRRRAVLAAAVLALASQSVTAQGAAAPPPAPPAGAVTMTTTERFLFVVRGDVLFQFDVASLALLNSFRFPAEGAPAAAAPAAALAPRGGPASPRPRPGAGAAPARSVAVAVAPTAEAMATGVDAALRWLAEHQDEDGRWDSDQFMKHDDAAGGEVSNGPGSAVHDVGVTGLAVLAFLADGHTTRAGEHRDRVRAAVQWLRDQQQDNGLIGTAASHDFIYNHAIAAYALCEAYGVSQQRALARSAQRSLDYLESHRNPYSVWRYQPRDNDNDTSVTTWAALALASGDAFGLQVNKEALKFVRVWYDTVSTPDGRHGYTKQGEPSSRLPGDHARRFPPQNGETLTAAAAYGRVALGETAQTEPVLDAAASLIATKPPRWQPGHVDAVYWFFGTRALREIGGPRWEAWRASLGDLLDNQCKDGNERGSWEPVGVWDESGGRVFVTALYALTLAEGARARSVVK